MASKWLQGCEICNTGLINRVDELVDGGISVNKACKLMAEEGERTIGDMVYSQAAIRARYRHYKGIKGDKKVGLKGQPNQKPITEQPETEQPQPEDVVPGPTELSANHMMEATKASANANKPKPSELEKAEKIIVKASKLLEAIVEGRIKDNGSGEDKLFAESIKRHGPSFIISYYQLGIDPQKAVNFYKGEKDHGKTTHIEANL